MWVKGIKLTRFGSNCNKRYYVGLIVGNVPDWKLTSHWKYPWWSFNSWKISICSTLGQIYE